MSLELALTEATAAMRELTAAINAIHQRTAARPNASAPAAKPAASAPTPTPAPAQAVDAKKAQAEAYSAVKTATLELVEKKGHSMALKVLGTFGAQKATELKAEQYAEYLAACAAMTTVEG